jgi:hypothetical protein
MNWDLGLAAKAALPLALTAFGTSFVASVEQRYDHARSAVVRTLHLEHQPADLGPRPAGMIEAWRREDASLRENALLTDAQGNTYFQSRADGHLRVVRLKPGFPLESVAPSDWMSHKLTDSAEREPVYFNLK